jgi:hypothetical protein
VGVPAARGHGVTSAENARNAAPQAPVPPSLRSLVNRRAARRLEQDHSALALRRRLWALGFILIGTNDLCILLGQKIARAGGCERRKGKGLTSRPAGGGPGTRSRLRAGVSYSVEPQTRQ